MTEELLEIRKKLSKKLKKDRFEHTIGVMYTAASLAMCYGEDVEKALTAGLLHDCAKYMQSLAHTWPATNIRSKIRISWTPSRTIRPGVQG